MKWSVVLNAFDTTIRCANWPNYYRILDRLPIEDNLFIVHRLDVSLGPTVRLVFMHPISLQGRIFDLLSLTYRYEYIYMYDSMF